MATPSKEGDRSITIKFLLMGLCKFGGRTEFRVVGMKDSREVLTRETRAHVGDDVWECCCAVWMFTFSSLFPLSLVRSSAKSTLITDVFVLMDEEGHKKVLCLVETEHMHGDSLTEQIAPS